MDDDRPHQCRRRRLRGLDRYVARKRSLPILKSRACSAASRTTPTTWATATAARRWLSRACPRSGSSRFSRWPTRPSPPSSRRDGKKAIRFTPEQYEKTYLELDGEHPRLVHLAAALVGPSHSRMALRRLPQDHGRARRSHGLRPLRVGGDHAGDRRAGHLVLLGPAAGLGLRLAAISPAERPGAPISTPSIPPACWSPASTFSSSGSPA